MKQFVILSGKGGTGKTSVTAAFAHLASIKGIAGKVVLADTDVDAANLELVLAPEVNEEHNFIGAKVAVVDQEECLACGSCTSICRFDAIHMGDVFAEVDPIACEGCGACVHQCPGGAIRLEEQVAGAWFRSESIYGPLFHAALKPAQENSGKLVSLVKREARKLAVDSGAAMMLVDGPPGIGCPVISAVSGADLALIVAEPSAAGVHDMRRVIQTTDHFKVPAVVVINKADLYPGGVREIEDFCEEQEIMILGKIPFDPVVTEAMVQGKAVTVYSIESKASAALKTIWSKVVNEYLV